jgi:hypothetical protein
MVAKGLACLGESGTAGRARQQLDGEFRFKAD